MFLCLFSMSIFVSGREIIYPKPESSFDERTRYPVKMLHLAIRKAGQNLVIKPSNKLMTQGRALLQLSKGLDVDVVWTMTSKEREAMLEPIRIPIYKGLIGWRLFLIEQSYEDAFFQAETTFDLKSYRLIQGHDWPDTEILRSNGFDVVGAPYYSTIFDMVVGGRADLFPRSIVEIWDEARIQASKRIVVESNHLVRYPTAFYFFVNKDDRALKKLLEDGLLKAIKDGSFDQMFYEQHQQYLDQADLTNRIIHDLDNPLLPALTPLENKNYWFSIK
ncbi:transporter substrate-binding domain-containing protein [Litoribacillus peritrichatus]|uniref:Transporter substrate-binding domain-containing protein n=2 Tax=Litoribacillus peritrichatus TaxID=718191 RepID=A0ABP7MCD2_9GAMM